MPLVCHCSRCHCSCVDVGALVVAEPAVVVDVDDGFVAVEGLLCEACHFLDTF